LIAAYRVPYSIFTSQISVCLILYIHVCCRGWTTSKRSRRFQFQNAEASHACTSVSLKRGRNLCRVPCLENGENRSPARDHVKLGILHSSVDGSNDLTCTWGKPPPTQRFVPHNLGTKPGASCTPRHCGRRLRVETKSELEYQPVESTASNFRRWKNDGELGAIS
jgi:hypothetical protein